MQHHVVTADDGVKALTELRNRPFERRVLERHYIAAVGAKKVVMVLTAWIGRLEARGTVTDVDALHEVKVVQNVKDAVDARDPNRTSTLAEVVEDLLRCQTALLLGELLDDGSTRLARAVAGSLQRFERMRRPFCGSARHQRKR